MAWNKSEDYQLHNKWLGTPRGQQVTSNFILTFYGSGEGVEGGDDLPVLPVGEGAPDHEAGQGERGEEEKEPDCAV